MHCFEIPRIFKLQVFKLSARRSNIDVSITRCRGYPAVEITTLADIDLATGEVAIPQDASRYVLSSCLFMPLSTRAMLNHIITSENLVVRATWKDVIRYKNDDSTES